ncbi:MAG: DUF2079 domain-containing protein [Ilumatobacteraceae bacterium]
MIGTAVRSFGERTNRRLRTVHPAAWLSFAGAVVFAVVCGRLGVLHHRNFGTWAYDMGIYDQGFWLVSRGGQSFVTVRGLEFWGHHVNLVAVLFAPFYWLGAGPSFLYVVQACVMGLGAIPVYLLARDRFRTPWMGLVFAVVFLMYAPVQWIVWANFHPEALVVTPLLASWWCARTRRWRWFTVFVVLALSMREDAALAVAMLGVVLAAPHLKDVLAALRSKSWGSISGDSGVAMRAGVYTFVAGSVWYLICTRFVIPHFNRGDEPFYVSAYYGNYGDTTAQVVGEILRRPQRVISDATQPDRLRFFRDLLLPLGVTPLLAPLQLLVAVPQMLASVIGTSPYARQIRWQYTSVMIAPLMVAAIDGARVVWRSRRLRGWLVVTLLMSSVVSNFAWSNSPWSDNSNVWAVHSPRVDVLRRAVDLVPDDASVTATFTIVPHLSRREQIYDWPNPWIESYWGVDDGYRLPSPDEIEWVVIDRNHVSSDHETVLDDIVGGGEFEVVLDESDVIVARRVED